MAVSRIDLSKGPIETRRLLFEELRKANWPFAVVDVNGVMRGGVGDETDFAHFLKELPGTTFRASTYRPGDPTWAQKLAAEAATLICSGKVFLVIQEANWLIPEPTAE